MNYCTIFDKNYLYQALAMILSVQRTAGEFSLYALCLDDEAFEVISKVTDGARVIPVRESALRERYPELVAHRERTSAGQYAWSIQPFAIQYILRFYKLPSVTYLEADSIFFSSPQPLFDEIGVRSVSAVPHRFSEGLDQTEKSGLFCVQFNFFRDDAWAHAMLDSWKTGCLEYRRERPMFFPGQKDLDSWPERFSKELAIIENIGAGVAPWNVAQFEVGEIADVPTVNGRPTVFYHYHEFSFLEGGGVDLGGYRLSASVVRTFYAPYMKFLAEAEELVHRAFPEFHYRKQKARRPGIAGLLESFKRRVRGCYNVFQPGAL